MSKYFYLIILAFLEMSVYGNSSFNYLTDRFSNISMKDGLSDNNIECIYRDQEGMMWFGTRNGLCRYDGYEFRVYRKSDEAGSISGNRILSICEDKQGFLWVGTYKDGINRFDRKTERFRHFTQGRSLGDRINRIRVLSDGSVWFCTNQGLAQYLPGADSFKIYLPDSHNRFAINSYIVSDIIETRSGSIYVATEANAIQMFNRKENRFIAINYKRDPALTDNYRKRIVEDWNGTLWIAANYHGLCTYNPSDGTSEIYTEKTGQLSTNVLMGDMAVAPDGKIWICTEGQGINICDPSDKTFRYLKHENKISGSLSSNHIYSVYFDNDKMLWIGTFDKGIDYFSPDQYKMDPWLFTPGDLEELKGKSVLSIFQDSKARIWIGTDGEGLYMTSRQEPLRHLYKGSYGKGLTSNVITAINEDGQGNILLGTYSGGMLSYNPERNTFISFLPDRLKQNALHSLNVWSIFHDSRDRIWLGLLAEGVDEYFPRTGTFVNYGPNSRQSSKIEFPNVMNIMEDSDGDIWFGTEGKGIYVLENQTNRLNRLFGSNAVLTSSVIKALFQDRSGYIWIGTEDNGLYRYSKTGNQLIRIYNDQGLPAGPVQSITEDYEGNKWIGTSSGLISYKPGDETFMHFLTDDGLSSNEFNPDALLKMNDGRLLCGTKNGLDVIKVDSLKLNRKLPKVILTRLTVLNQNVLPGKEINDRVIITRSISYTDTLVLTQKDKIFTIEFAALNYLLPEKCNYQYKLENFDDNWVATTSERRVASYSNLDPGDYIFRVKASNNDGFWGRNEVSLVIIIKPPFWETWWFRLVLVFLLVILIFIGYRWRLNRHKELFRQHQLAQERKIITLEKEKMESDLKQLAFQVINRNKLLVEQKNRLLRLIGQSKAGDIEGINKLIEKIDVELDEDKDWKYIEPQLDKTYNSFITRLKEKHPDITLSEIKIAAYIRMNLTTKEISEFMHKTIRAVENDRYRLRKKIGLDINDSLSNYLMNL